MNAQGSSNCCASKAKQLHVAIIGSGSAAFSCAIKAAEKKLQALEELKPEGKYFIVTRVQA